MNKYAQVYLNAYVNKMAQADDDKPGEGEEEVEGALEAERQKDNNAMVAANKAETEDLAHEATLTGNKQFEGRDNEFKSQIGSDWEGNREARIGATDGPSPTPRALGQSYGTDAMGQLNPDIAKRFGQAIAPIAPIAPKSLKDRWSEFHGKGPKDAYNLKSKRDVAMLKAMEAAQSGGERAIRAVANGPLSRPAIRPARR